MSLFGSWLEAQRKYQLQPSSLLTVPTSGRWCWAVQDSWGWAEKQASPPWSLPQFTSPCSCFGSPVTDCHLWDEIPFFFPTWLCSVFDHSNGNWTRQKHLAGCFYSVSSVLTSVIVGTRWQSSYLSFLNVRITGMSCPAQQTCFSVQLPFPFPGWSWTRQSIRSAASLTWVRGAGTTCFDCFVVTCLRV